MKIRIRDRWFNQPKVLTKPSEHSLGYQHLDLEDDIDSTNECLFFVFEGESNDRVFHMRNVSFDIQLYALDQNKNLVDAFPMSSNSMDNYKIKGPCKFVIEVPLKRLTQ